MALTPQFLNIGRDHFFLLDPATPVSSQLSPCLAEMVEANSGKKHVFIDESQKLPSLLGGRAAEKVLHPYRQALQLKPGRFPA